MDMDMDAPHTARQPRHTAISHRVLRKLYTYLHRRLRNSKQNNLSPAQIPSVDTLKHEEARSQRQISRQRSQSPKATSSTPQFQQALVVARKGEYELRRKHEMPEMQGEDEVMIRSCCVGLNPIDWKSVAYNFCLPSFPWITGREMAGIVERVGANVAHVRPGDRVWTSTYYRDVRAGCFQEHVVVPQHTVLPIPSGLSFEAASCLGVAGLTACMALWHWLAVPMPRTKPALTPSGVHTPLSECADSGYQSSVELPSSSTSIASHDDLDEWILIWGGSTVTGQFATQLARLSGLKPITVCSERTAELSRSLGAEHVVVRDNRQPSDILADISRVSSGRITRALDLVGNQTAAFCLHACATPQQRETLGDQKVHFAPLAMMSSTQVVPGNVQVETVEMKQFVLNPSCARYARRLNDLVGSGDLQMPAMDVISGGLAAVEAGLEIVKRGDRGGRKVILKM